VEPDEALAALAASGDAAAFDQLVRRHQAALVNFAFRMLGDRDEAADAVQQTFVQVYVNLPRARLHLAFKPWLYRIARNQCLDRLRQRRPTLPIDREVDADDPPAFDLRDPDPLPEELLERRDLQRLLADAIGTLPERYRAVVAMRYVTDLTFAEIGAALGLPENTVKTFFQRAKALLREYLRARLE
jgi:RNA polymerase sigma-70 factor (ECF subfamily)